MALNEMRLNLSLTHRVIRRVGIGVNIGLPVISGFNSNFSGSATTGNSSYFQESNSEFGGSGSLYPSEYKHDLQNPYTLTFYPRFFLGGDIGELFVDVRFNIMRVSEQFTFVRGAVTSQGSTDVNARNIRFDETYTAKGIGVKIGIQSKFSEHFFLSYSLTLDRYNFDQIDGFRYLIEYQDNGSGYDSVFLQSALNGVDISWQFGYTIGYVF